MLIVAKDGQLLLVKIFEMAMEKSKNVDFMAFLDFFIFSQSLADFQ